jgi:hypothetical protein
MTRTPVCHATVTLLAPLACVSRTRHMPLRARSREIVCVRKATVERDVTSVHLVTKGIRTANLVHAVELAARMRMCVATRAPARYMIEFLLRCLVLYTS